MTSPARRATAAKAWPAQSDASADLSPARGRGCRNAGAAGRRRSGIELVAKPAGEILDELPGDPARARAPRDRPLERFSLEFVGCHLELVVGGVAVHHGQVFVLGGVVKAEPQAEAV